MIDLAALTEAVYQRLSTDDDGAVVRDLLGAGAASVLLAEDLRVEGLTVAQLPARPLVALRRNAAPQIDRVITRPIYTLYAYADPSEGYGAIEQIPLAVQLAFESGLAIGTVGVGDIEVAAGGQLRDNTLQLLFIPISITIGGI